MSRIKKVLASSTILILMLPQVPVKAISYEVNSIANRYEKVTVVNRERLFSIAQEETTIEESEDVMINREEKESYELLVPKTDANYEIALSYEDGSYAYVDNADTYDEAVYLANAEVSQVSLITSSEIIIPVVINSSGATLYATESIGRVNSLTGEVCNIYSDSTMKNAFTYTNHNFINEVPLIEDGGNVAKVLVSGYEGWMYKWTDGNINKNLEIRPITDVKNPSYYYVENGMLKHYLAAGFAKTTGYVITIGIAPSDLNTGVQYFSYDGNYFYAGSYSSPAAGLKALTIDLKNGNHNNAVNDVPYYNYYNYLPFRTKTNYTADEINTFINNNTFENSKLRGLGQAFIDNQNKYGVNALLALGLAINESGWGKSTIALEKNNLFGLNAVDVDPYTNADEYSSPEACVEEFCKYWISKGYANPDDARCYGGFLGNKQLGGNVKYASDPYWGEKAAQYAFKADYEMSGKDITRMKDYNYYQLIKYTGTSMVRDAFGNTLYEVNSTSISGDGASLGGVTAMVSSNIINVAGTSSYEVYAERTTAMNIGSPGPVFGGIYDWKTKGYVDSTSVVYINEGKTRRNKEDVNFDGNIDVTDLAILGISYNKIEGDKYWKDRQDMNNDGIIDIYDIAKLSKKL